MSEKATDIVARLRAPRMLKITSGSNTIEEADPDHSVREDAAAEIERLRAALQRVDILLTNTKERNAYEAGVIVREAAAHSR